ncbi:TPA: hypothetical protein HA239_03460 [Candidatus Woesearchaeota archaeon]|nr:hypothetical protein QT06_C0001G0022 [archaeon GW2011_AR15]MBS3104167.1 hypothetical protein [Candidatus Woesearchaeota archaeon]HIH41447.1 hypothetical protein [Candidatus Woesearchaeota archaeon]
MARFDRGSKPERRKPRGFGGRRERDNDSDGFDRPRGGRPGGFERRSPRDREMYKIICDKCGKESEVPFKPTSSKPIYCRDCFKKEDSREGGRPGSGGSAKEFDEINMKLNKIMKALDIE